MREAPGDMSEAHRDRSRGGLSVVGPGLLVAATGVGAGDLITAGLAGAELGLVIVWVPLVGAALKFVLNEGLARWQIATGTTLLAGWCEHLGRPFRWIFGAYLILWSLVVGAAMISACGIAGAALFPFGDPETARWVWGGLHSLAGLMLVRRGGFRLFEGAMTAMIALMFVAVMLTAVVVSSRSGLVWPAPSLPGDSGPWVLGVLGGVGGTVTLLAYGYWIAEHDRKGFTGLLTCRLDLTLCYALTGLFGAAMIVIASQTTLTGSGSRVAVELAEQLGATFGPGGRLVFLVGFWGAVFTSLLGVWQGVPYLFADFAGASREGKPLTTTSSYRHFQLGLATVPMVIVFFGTVRSVQLAYTVTGALFMPLLAVTLLILNNRSGLVGRFRNGWLVNLALIATLVLFVVIGADTLAGVVASATG